MDNLALVIDTTSKYSDVWPMYFGQLDKHLGPQFKKYLFTDYCLGISGENMVRVYYDNVDSYRNQILNCLKQVEEEYIIYNSEDYVLYGDVNMDNVVWLLKYLKDGYDFIKFIKGPEKTQLLEDDVHIIDPNDDNFFAQQCSIWRTESLIRVIEKNPLNSGRMEVEPAGSAICRTLGIKGLQYFEGTEKKRGLHHYDSFIWPSIATAVVKGKWNVREYPNELIPLFEEYNINPNDRGTV